MDFVRYMAYISQSEYDIDHVQGLMIGERDERLESQNQHKEKDKRLKDGDLKAIYERHYNYRFHELKDSALMVDRREANQSQVRAGKGHDSAPSTEDSGGCRTSDGSCSGSSTPLLRSIHVTQPELSDEASFSRKRREIIDGHVSLPPTKRQKALITTSTQAIALQRPSSLRVKEISSGLQKVSPGHQFGPGPGDEPWEDGVITSRVAGETSPAKHLVLSGAQRIKRPLELEKRSLTYQHDVSRPTISPFSDAPTEQLASKPLPTTASTSSNPLHQMLDKITTGFTDNLFFLHGILRTYAEVDTARARGEALDAAAADVLKTLDIFRKRVELISEGILKQPAPPNRRSKLPTAAGDQTTPEAVHRRDSAMGDARNTPQSGRGHEDSPQEMCLREEQITRTTPLNIPLGRRAVDSNQGHNSQDTGTAPVPRHTYRELREELFVNPWSTERR